MGRRVLARLHRALARMVAHPAPLRGHPRTPGAAGAQAGMGRGEPQLHVDLPRAASRDAMHALLEGLVPGLPTELEERILERAEGIPLYAVETVRCCSIAVRSCWTAPSTARRRRSRRSRCRRRCTRSWRPAWTVSARGTPCTPGRLGARQDVREAGPRCAVGSVRIGPRADPRVAHAQGGAWSQSDPRSPEHGQYGFLQDMLRRVAYETLAKSDRKRRHLAAAAYLEESWGEHEVVEVVASHYLDAFELAPDAADAAEIRSRAGERLALAGSARHRSGPARKESATSPRPRT